MVPTHNTELAAAIGLYMTCADGEWAAEVYGAAADRGQASIAFDVAVDMVDQAPALKKRIKLVLSKKRMIYLPTKSFYQVLSAEAYTKHGLNVHGVVFDELHAQPNRNLYDVLTKGSGDARQQPLYFIITTAGDDPDRTSIGWEVHEKARKILEGLTPNPIWYPVIYGIGEDDDPGLEKNWRKANPSLGYTIDLEKVSNAWRDAQQNPSDERSFRQLRLNQWVKNKAATKWISLDMWDKSSGLYPKPEKLKGRPCYGGLDLSSKIDLTSFVLLFPPFEDDPKWYVLPFFWIPEENMNERVKRDHVPYDRWVKKGLIQTTPGNVIDYKFIEKTILEQADLYDIQEVGYDPWNALQVATNLGNEGLTFVEVRQGAKSMSPAMKEVEVQIRKKALQHGGHDVLRWNLGNIEVKQDENENIRPVKGKRVTERIDGVVATINAMARAMLYQGEGGESVYEKRGVLTF